MDKKELEQTLVLIKPDALKNSLTGYVLSQLSQFHTGLRFAGAIVSVSFWPRNIMLNIEGKYSSLRL
jgi:nucleoside diphosphate kinase